MTPRKDDDRAARLKAALKANMGRRKGQARSRAAADHDDDAAPRGDATEQTERDT